MSIQVCSCSCIFAGLLVQWPLGWLSDRYDRAVLIHLAAVGLALAAARWWYCQRAAG